jgi:endonuclease-8
MGRTTSMPEGHLLHRLARDQGELVGRRLEASSPQGRFAEGAATLDGRDLVVVEAYGKHLHHRFEGDGGPGLHTHLGMQGKWIRLAGDRPPRPQVRLRLATAEVAWDLIAPGTCELLDQAGWEALVRGLGVDPLSRDPDEERAWKAVTSHAGPIGAALLDQSVVAGVGNVLRAESLFRAGIHPSRPASGVDRAEFDRLWTSLVDLMRQAVDDGRIITAPLPAAERATVAESDGRMVYKQSHCRRCATPVESWTMDGRTAYACPNCQPR